MSLLSKYKPVFQTSGEDWALKAEMAFHQHLCYHEGKVHGGILALFLNHIFADCYASIDTSRRAVTADLHLSYVQPVSPNIPTSFHVRVVKVEGRKVRMSGIVSFVDQKLGEVVAVNAEALFIFLAAR
jgi:uncharacterized protein (TIGR00369 family)